MTGSREEDTPSIDVVDIILVRWSLSNIHNEPVMPMFQSCISSSSLKILSKAFQKSKCMISMVV